MNLCNLFNDSKDNDHFIVIFTCSDKNSRFFSKKRWFLKNSETSCMPSNSRYLRKFFIPDQGGLELFRSNFASCSYFRQKVENFHLHFFFLTFILLFLQKYFLLQCSSRPWLSTKPNLFIYLNIQKFYWFEKLLQWIKNSTFQIENHTPRKF